MRKLCATEQILRRLHVQCIYRKAHAHPPLFIVSNHIYEKIVKDARAHTRKKALLFACHLCDDTRAPTTHGHYIKSRKKIDLDRRPIFRENSAEIWPRPFSRRAVLKRALCVHVRLHHGRG